jgi:hypothetical protein
LHAIHSTEYVFKRWKKDMLRDRVLNTIVGYPFSIIYGIKQKFLIFMVFSALILLGAIGKAE